MKYKILVDESVSSKKLHITLKCIGNNKFITENIVNISKEYPGIPDIEIIKHLMDKATIFITTDRVLHNRMLKYKFLSYYINNKNQVSEKYLNEIKLKNKKILNTNLSDSYKLNIPKFHNALQPSSAKLQKKYRTKRRRIRNYFDGILNISEVNVTLSKIDIAAETIIGFRIKISSKSGISALDASEVYIKDKFVEDNIALFCFVLIELILLILSQIKLNIYYDSSFINNTVNMIENSNYSELFNKLKTDFSEISLTPVNKGFKIEHLRMKLKDLSINDIGNEVNDRSIKNYNKIIADIN